MGGDGRDYGVTNGQGNTDDGSALNEELQNLQKTKPWRANWNQVAPEVWRPPTQPQTSSGPQDQTGWSSNTPGGDQGGAANPDGTSQGANTDTGNWRAHPGVAPLVTGIPTGSDQGAGGNNQGGAQNPGDQGTGNTGPADDGHWHPSTNPQPVMQIPTTDGTGHKPVGANTALARQAADAQSRVSDALGYHTGLFGNEMLAGISGVVVRGAGSRFISSAARSYLLNTELPAKYGLFVHRNFGLQDGGRFMGQISRKEDKLSSSISDAAKGLEEPVKTIRNSLVGRSLTEDEQKTLVRYYELQGKDAPPGFTPGALTAADKALVQQFSQNDAEIRRLTPIVDSVNKVWEPKVKEQAAVNDALDNRIAVLDGKITAAGGPGVAANKEMVDAQQYLKDVRINPSTPMPAGLKLEDIDELNVKKAQSLGAEIASLRPGKTAEADLERLQKDQERISGEFKASAGAIKADAEAAERKWRAAETTITTDGEKKVLKQHEILGRGGMDEIPKGVLTPEQEKLVKERQSMQERLGLMPHDEAIAQSERLKARITSFATPLESEARSIEATLAANPKALLTEDQKAVKAAYDWLKTGARGPMPAEASSKVGAEARYLIGQRNVYGSSASIADLEATRRALPEQIKKFAEGLRDKGLELEHRSTLPGNVFTPAEKNQLDVFRYFKDGAKDKMPALSALSEDQAAFLGHKEALEARLSGVLGESELKASRGFKDAAHDFAKGWIIGEGVNLADDVLDRALHGTASLHNQGYFKSLVVPTSILTPGGFWSKAITSSAVALAGTGLDHILPQDKNPQFARFMRPNSMEAITVTGALMIPMKEDAIALRAATVGLAWAGSHMMNLLGSKSSEDVKNDAVGSWKSDETKRSFDSMKGAIDEMNELSSFGREGEAQVHTWFASWLGNSHPDPITAARGNAILATSIGETTLKDGLNMGYHGGNTQSFVSSLFKGHNPKEQDYILAGEDIDVGGRALKYLRFAAKSVDDAKAATQARLGNDDHGKTVTQSEIDDLNRIGNRIADDRARILGKHDIPKIYSTMEDYTKKLGQPEMEKIYNGIKSDLQKQINTGSKDQQFMGKLYRDLALVDLSWAKTETDAKWLPNGESAAALYAEAQQALANAAQCDGGNEDLPQLNSIAQDLAAQIPAAQDQQWQKGNILGVDRQ